MHGACRQWTFWAWEISAALEKKGPNGAMIVRSGTMPFGEVSRDAAQRHHDPQRRDLQA
jgi:hypothetical protein